MKINPTTYLEVNYTQIAESEFWNKEENAELKMHKIHVYPAKFPSFIVAKSLSYARVKGISVESVGDIFCGCGTTALEAKRRGKDFWGCDINPVATLITRVKTTSYDEKILASYFNEILEISQLNKLEVPKEVKNDDRINYWFDEDQIVNLYNLRETIKQIVVEDKYQDFFLVAFSNILKGASRWLTKSIKPTIDKNKKKKDVYGLFKRQFKTMLVAAKECKDQIRQTSETKIVTNNFLNFKFDKPFLDLLITSPPYVTSYEYADIHQLSSLWLSYTNDYRTLRDGTIGSLYHRSISEDSITNEINIIGKNIYLSLVKAKKANVKSIAKYFIDIKDAISKSYSIINDGGLAIYVIGNTTYKKVYVDNAKYATACMFESGFKEVEIFKRKISSKILSPYRDADGKFSNDKRKKKIYNYEFVLIAKK